MHRNRYRYMLRVRKGRMWVGGWVDGWVGGWVGGVSCKGIEEFEREARGGGGMGWGGRGAKEKEGNVTPGINSSFRELP